MSDLPVRPVLRPIEGGGDIVEALESALAMARAGHLEMVAIVAINGDDEIMTRLAWHGDMQNVWSRAYAALASFQHDLMEDGL